MTEPMVIISLLGLIFTACITVLGIVAGQAGRLSKMETKLEILFQHYQRTII